MEARFVIAVIPRNSCLWISWLQSLFAVILVPKKMKSVTASTFQPSTYREVIGPVSMILVVQILSCNPAFSLSYFALIKRFLSYSPVSAIRVVSSAYLSLLLLLPAILIPDGESSSPAFHMMYSACKLNNQRDNIQPCHTLFPIIKQSAVPSLVLTVPSWPGYRFLRRQVR